jgi:head-tail adaptor
MSERKIKRRRLKQYAAGDMRDRIILHVRSIQPPVLDSADFSEEYDTGTKLWSSFNTLDLQSSGLRMFDGVNINERPTHKIIIRYRQGVTTENVIAFRGVYYEIMLVQNPEERNQYLELFCRVRGDKTLEANT